MGRALVKFGVKCYFSSSESAWIDIKGNKHAVRSKKPVLKQDKVITKNGCHQIRKSLFIQYWELSREMEMYDSRLRKQIDQAWKEIENYYAIPQIGDTKEDDKKQEQLELIELYSLQLKALQLKAFKAKETIDKTQKDTSQQEQQEQQKQQQQQQQQQELPNRYEYAITITHEAKSVYCLTTNGNIVDINQMDQTIALSTSKDDLKDSGKDNSKETEDKAELNIHDEIVAIQTKVNAWQTTLQNINDRLLELNNHNYNFNAMSSLKRDAITKRIAELNHTKQECMSNMICLSKEREHLRSNTYLYS